MPWHFYVVLVGAALLFFVLQKRSNKVIEERAQGLELPKPDKQIRLYGGPFDEREHNVVEYDPFYIIPFAPKPDDEDIEVVGRLGDTEIIMPKFAFYQQVVDGDYFFRRNLTLQEVQAYHESQQLPSDLGGNSEASA